MCSIAPHITSSAQNLIIITNDQHWVTIVKLIIILSLIIIALSIFNFNPYNNKLGFYILNIPAIINIITIKNYDYFLIIYQINYFEEYHHFIY